MELKDYMNPSSVRIRAVQALSMHLQSAKHYPCHSGIGMPYSYFLKQCLCVALWGASGSKQVNKYLQDIEQTVGRGGIHGHTPLEVASVFTERMHKEGDRCYVDSPISTLWDLRIFFEYGILRPNEVWKIVEMITNGMNKKLCG